MPSRRDPAALRAEIRRLKREVAELRAAEASYRTIVDRTNSIVLRWDPEGRILFLNDFGLRLFGYTLEEVVGHSVLGLIVPDTETSGRDLVASASEVNDALGALAGRTLEDVSLTVHGPGAFGLSLAVDGKELTVRLDRSGVRVHSVGV